MAYQIGEFAQLAGISTRTLRYYDKFGLLHPSYITASGYRIYDSAQVDLLQQILFFRELDLSLDEIKGIIKGADFEITAALNSHLTTLKERKARIGRLISLVETSINHQKGAIIMTDAEKLLELKQTMVEENERKYGVEIREKYGDETIDQTNQKILGLTQEELEKMKELEEEIGRKLATACQQGDPFSSEGREVAALHKKWLQFTWKSYSKEKHLGLVQLYLITPEFTEFYERYGTGCTLYLAKAVEKFLA